MRKWILFAPILSLLLIVGCSSKDKKDDMEMTDTVSTTDSSSYEKNTSSEDAMMMKRGKAHSMDKKMSASDYQKTFSKPTVIEKVQSELNDRGYAAGVTDGILGRNTSKALERFQRHEGLDSTGRINLDTVRALNLEDSVMQESEEFAE